MLLLGPERSYKRASPKNITVKIFLRRVYVPFSDNVLPPENLLPSDDGFRIDTRRPEKLIFDFLFSFTFSDLWLILEIQKEDSKR